MTRLVSLAALAALAVGCSARASPPAADDPECASPTRCPNDPPPDANHVDTCQRALASACGPTYRAYLDCAARNRTCDATGRSDPAAVDAACAGEANAYAACVAGPPDSAFFGHA